MRQVVAEITAELLQFSVFPKQGLFTVFLFEFIDFRYFAGLRRRGGFRGAPGEINHDGLSLAYAALDLFFRAGGRDTCRATEFQPEDADYNIRIIESLSVDNALRPVTCRRKGVSVP